MSACDKDPTPETGTIDRMELVEVIENAAARSRAIARAAVAGCDTTEPQDLREVLNLIADYAETILTEFRTYRRLPPEAV